MLKKTQNKNFYKYIKTNYSFFNIKRAIKSYNTVRPKLNFRSNPDQQHSHQFPCLLARASCASIAVFLPLKAGGLADTLWLLLCTFSIRFLCSLETKQTAKRNPMNYGKCLWQLARKKPLKPTCSYYDFCCDDGALSLSLSETLPFSFYLCYVIVVCPYFCCDAA